MSFLGHVHRRLVHLRDAHLHRVPIVVTELGGGRVEVDGRRLIQLASNDYLGLAHDPRLARAVAAAAEGHGGGAGAARLITGTTPAHVRAEQAAAAFVGAERALLFSTGYLANIGVLQALAGPEDLVISDALNHASIIDGCRLSGAHVVVTPHRDVEAVRRALNQHRGGRPAALIVTESVFSMDGTEAPLSELRRLADEHGTGLVVDEAHALGVLGPEGRGLARDRGVVPDVLIGTLGKAMGLMGAFAAAADPVIDLVLNRARTFVFSTGISPAIAGAVDTALELVRQADERRAALHDATARLAAGLTELGYDVRPGIGPILPVLLGAPDTATELARRLEIGGVLVRAIRPPTVPAGTSRLRAVPTALTTPALVDEALAAFARAR